ncbi:hypothetical protein OIU34_00315 [Pararhizobium sp. BT-229]|uniref:hypothetical protein n=1 Tax=Pararhizobium sp. BT-229 TaxID=2986923 RepID=UPI0021F79AD0|nr:hypothetical protein [Pararhizobium sp. BT-229]MCV9960330.1 hypothetical protein [Pararhizobium sp. BT-229]
MDQQQPPFSRNASAREMRSASLRFVALSILFANLAFGDGLSSVTTHLIVSGVYLFVSETAYDNGDKQMDLKRSPFQSAPGTPLVGT